MRAPAWLARVVTSPWILLALVQVPLIAALVHAWRGGWVPAGDHGLIVLRATDVLTANHPWLGTWSSSSLSVGANLNNPGPLLFDALAPFVKVFGASSGAVLGVAVLNGTACAIALRQGRHLGGRRGEMLLATACLLLSWSLGSEMLTDPWQPHMLQLPFLAFLACAAAVASGRVQSVPWLVGLASYLVQSHLSFVYMVAIVGATVLFVGGRALHVSTTTGGVAATWRRAAMTTAAVGVVCWWQPLYEQLFGPGRGNLGRLAGATSAESEPIGFKLGVKLVARVIALPRWFLRPSFNGSIPPTAPSADGELHVASLPFGIVAICSLAVVLAIAVLLLRQLHRLSDPLLRCMLLVAVAAMIAAVASMLVIPVGAIGLSPHQMRWLWPISVLLWASIVAGALRVLPMPWSLAGKQWTVSVVALAALALLTVPAYTTDHGPAADRRYWFVVNSIMQQLNDASLAEPVLFDSSTLRFAEPFSGPVLLVLLDNDQPVTTDDEGFVRQLGEGRRANGDERWLLQILEGDAAVSPRATMQVLAYADDLTPDERAELLSLEEDGTDPARLEVLVDRRRALAVAIVLIPTA